LELVPDARLDRGVASEAGTGELPSFQCILARKLTGKKPSKGEGQCISQGYRNTQTSSQNREQIKALHALAKVWLQPTTAAAPLASKARRRGELPLADVP